MNIAFAVFLGMRAIKQGAGAGKGVEVEVDKTAKEKEEALKRPKLLIFNILFTVAVIGILATGWVTSYVVFMVGVCIALTVNYPNQKIQDSLVKKHAPAALMISVTLLSAGAMVGIFNQTGMLEAMADVIMGIIPPFMGQIHTHNIRSSSSPDRPMHGDRRIFLRYHANRHEGRCYVRLRAHQHSSNDGHRQELGPNGQPVSACYVSGNRSHRYRAEGSHEVQHPALLHFELDHGSVWNSLRNNPAIVEAERHEKVCECSSCGHSSSK